MPVISRISAQVAGIVGIVFVIGTIVGCVFGWIGHRKRKALRRYPWATWPIRYIRVGGDEWVELVGQDGVSVSTLQLSTWPSERGKLVDFRTRHVWFAGNPLKYGVVSAPGGGDLRYAYRSTRKTPPELTFRTDDSTSRRDPDTSYELVRKDGSLAMRPVGGPPEEATPYGRKGDVRYPSPRMLRRVIAFALDWLIHVGCGVSAAIAVTPGFTADAIAHHDWQHVGVNPVVVVGFFLVASAFDRIIIQSIFHTTIGKAVFGLVVIRPQDGKYPSFGRLVAVWLFHIYLPLGIFGNGAGPDRIGDYFLPAVRRQDVLRGSAM
ncbi:RDD family protein [Nocardia sp. NPDC046473]|uniref:RDD family protein n=1 Tax=Nocardia sp. NPDC046473 TaxID=3155733 RepID=UPI0033C25336